MRLGASKHLTRAVVVMACMAGVLSVSSSAYATSGAAFTTINSTADAAFGGAGGGQGLCHNGNGNVNCNQYFAKAFVWINGGPNKNGLSDGTYFFAVNVPGSQPDPNDKAPFTYPKPQTDGNLSDDYDPYTNRTFTVKSGEIFSYAGTHDQGMDVNDNSERKIRLFPYSDTTNNGGVYILSICQLTDAQGNPVNGGYPVDPKECKYDAFKILEDTTPPTCPPPTFAFNTAGMGIAKQLISDPGGIDSIEIKNIVNLNVSPMQPGVNWFQGTTMSVNLTATEIVRGAGSRIQIIVTDVGGNVSECDPVLASLKVRPGLGSGPTRAQSYRVSERENRVTIRNGRPGLSRVVAVVNGRKFVARGLRAGERRVLRIGSALRKGHSNRVTIRGIGGRKGDADIMISN
jgi:hypothetical protein